MGTQPSNQTSAGRVCTVRVMTENCNINCSNASPECTGENSGSSFTFSAQGSVSSTSWTVLEAYEGATCRLLCVEEDNLDVTATCSWNGKEMEWYRPGKLEERCGGNSSGETSDPNTNTAPVST